ncbi:hypothetical protein BDV59DRAFT_4414 [Aspergillus ambiguus]|uniref:uncharacterized protein n=1 Tax=Aspergillus ambiguus TaxID=176160 RepID=UPI003CCD8C0D
MDASRYVRKRARFASASVLIENPYHQKQIADTYSIAASTASAACTGPDSSCGPLGTRTTSGSKPSSSRPIRRRRSSPRSPRGRCWGRSRESPGTGARCRCPCRAGGPWCPWTARLCRRLRGWRQLRPGMWFGWVDGITDGMEWGGRTFETMRYPMCCLAPSRLCSGTPGPSRGMAATEAASARSAPNFMMRLVVKEVEGGKRDYEEQKKANALSRWTRKTRGTERPSQSRPRPPLNAAIFHVGQPRYSAILG